MDSIANAPIRSHACWGPNEVWHRQSYNEANKVSKLVVQTKFIAAPCYYEDEFGWASCELIAAELCGTCARLAKERIR